MSVDEKRGFALVEKLAFERVSGTCEEKRAAQILRDEAASFGIEAVFDPFSVEDGDVFRAEFEVLEPYRKSYAVTGYKRALSTPPEGITGDFLYVENGETTDLADAEGKIVLVNRLSHDSYARIKKAGALAAVTFSGTIEARTEDSDINICKLRPTTLDGLDPMPAVNMHVWDAIELVKRGASKIRLTVQGENVVRESQNVVAVIPGTDRADEEIVFGAHYDSVYFSTGVYDNAAGCAVLMELMRHFAANPPRRTLKFIFFGSEEQGLLGSKHYAAVNDLSKTVIMINVDVGAPALGFNMARLACDAAGIAYIDGLLKEHGYSFAVSQGIQSSDSVPFTDADIPCLNLNRAAAPGAGFMHSNVDTTAFLSSEGLGKTLFPVLMISDRLANAAFFPIKREIPKEIRESVDKYLFRK